MKKLLLILCMGCTVNLTYAQDQNAQQSIQDSHHTVLGYIRGGTITDASNNFLGDFKAMNGMSTVSDKNHKVIGYLAQGTVVMDANHHVLGHIASNGKGTYSYTITNAENKTLGYINEEKGIVQDALRNTIGYEVNTEVAWAAPYFFFFKF
jgi:hypothetical protein